MKTTLLLCGLAGCALVVFVLWLADDSAWGGITVSKETTRLEGPLSADGYVDYVAALNAEASEGVTPENNAAVLFTMAVGPCVVSPEHHDEFFRKLGIGPLPEDGQYLVSMEEFASGRSDAKVVERGSMADSALDSEHAGGEDSGADSDLVTTLKVSWEKAVARPWRTGEFPELADWIRANEKPLSLIVEGSRCDRWYMPFVPGWPATMVEVETVCLRPAQDVVLLLACRAMLHAGERRGKDAASDLVACHRLGRFLARAPTLVSLLLGLGMESLAWQSDTALVHSGGLDPEALEAFARRLQDLPARPAVAETIDRGERFLLLDAIAAVERLGTGSAEKLLGDTTAVSGAILAGAPFDFDAILRRANAMYDRLVTIARLEDRAQRGRRFEAFHREFLEASARARGFWSRAGAVFSRRTRSQLLGDVLLALFLPDVDRGTTQEERAAMETDLLRIAIALERWRRARGDYPASLDALAGTYLETVPLDRFSGSLPSYARNDSGYVLWSVGEDGIDQTAHELTPGGDGGEEVHVSGAEHDEVDRDDGHDDIVVRAPAR